MIDLFMTSMVCRQCCREEDRMWNDVSGVPEVNDLLFAAISKVILCTSQDAWVSHSADLCFAATFH
jgi:hypothetical protein